MADNPKKLAEEYEERMRKLSNLSKAIFKVGFASIDKRLNHFMINTNAENYKVFAEEMFKYLRILNKI